MNKVHFVGLDVHKEDIVGAVASEKKEVEQIGTFSNEKKGIKKLVKKLKELSQTGTVRVVYEAGPTGYVLKRQLEKEGYECEVAAPSLTPKKAGEHIKTDRRDAIKLAHYYRSGDLTLIMVPNEKQESIRNLTRIRLDFVEDARRVKVRITHFLLRLGIKYSGKTKWSETHMSWLESMKLPDEQDAFVLTEYCAALKNLNQRIQKMTEYIVSAAETNEYRDKVNALCAYYGISVISAMTLLTEIIDFRRFDHPKKLMAFLGLVPSERSSGDTRRQGSITKAGNTNARRCLVESSWTAIRKQTYSAKTKHYLDQIPSELHAGPEKARDRLRKRYLRLMARKKFPQVAIVAVARELVGFLWSTMTMIESGNLSTAQK